MLGADEEQLKKDLQDFFSEGQAPPPQTTTMISHLCNYDPSSLTTVQSQLEALWSIPNFHWWHQVKMDGSPVESIPQVSYSQHILYHPDSESMDPSVKSPYKPCSPRNQIISFLLGTMPVKRLILYMLTMDDGLRSYFAEDYFQEESFQRRSNQVELQDQVVPEWPDMEEGSQLGRKRKKRKYGARLQPLSLASYCEKKALNYEEIISEVQGAEQSLYERFKEQVMVNGMVQWRRSDHGTEVVLMNDYDVTSGQLLPNTFVHVTATKTEETLIWCSCKAYSQLQETAGEGVIPQLNQLRQIACLGAELTCMHCRLFRDQCLGLDEIDRRSNFQTKVQTKLPDDESSVVLVDSVYPQSITKFSVWGEDRFSFIHLWFKSEVVKDRQQQVPYVQCQDGTCSATSKRSAKVKKSWY